MPCKMYGSDEELALDQIATAQQARKIAYEAMEKANEVTDILCRVLRSLPPEIQKTLDPDTRQWFEDHKRLDVVRKQYNDYGELGKLI